MQVPDFVRIAGDQPLFSHRSPQMLDLLARLDMGCRPLFGASSEVLFLASSGTGALESAICNLTSPGDEIIVVVGGVFARRFVEIGEAYGLSVRSVDVDWRVGSALADIQTAVARWPKAEVVFITWSESSTGVLIDLEAIGKFVRSQDKILVADAVSGLAVSPLSMDEWNIDAVVAGSQKGLMMPTGLGLVAVGPRAWQKNETSKSPRFYWEWKQYRANNPFTPALSLMFQLEASLAYIHSETREKIFDRRARVAERIRELVRRSGMEIYAKKPGNGITGVIPPQGFDIRRLIQRLELEFGIQISGGLGPLEGKMFRVGHVGHLSDEEVDYFADAFERCLS
jgi:aspartate aminotransferase-like enzyme